MRKMFCLGIALLMSTLAGAQSRNLTIYWIDVEGGAATLFLSPSGESLLIDTGFETDDRDARRIVAAMHDAGIKNIDHLIISHYHADHVGGLATLAKMVPIAHFYGRGDEIEPVNQKWLDSYRAAASGRRTIVKPGWSSRPIRSCSRRRCPAVDRIHYARPRSRKPRPDPRTRTWWARC